MMTEYEPVIAIANADIQFITPSRVMLLQWIVVSLFKSVENDLIKHFSFQIK